MCGGQRSGWARPLLPGTPFGMDGDPGKAHHVALLQAELPRSERGWAAPESGSLSGQWLSQ